MKNQSFIRRTGFALAGLSHSIKTEHSVRQHLVVDALVVLTLLITQPAPLWWAVMLLACGVMLAVELINTAVEKLVDHLHPQLHEAVRIVKDTLSGAVMVTCITGGLVLIAFLWMEAFKR
jgi:diacylglycerol kinase (ATP)